MMKKKVAAKKSKKAAPKKMTSYPKGKRFNKKAYAKEKKELYGKC